MALKYTDLSLGLTGPDERVEVMDEAEKIITDDSLVSIWSTRWVALAFTNMEKKIFTSVTPREKHPHSVLNTPVFIVYEASRT